MLVYIHIPFCHRICPYCSFYKHTPGATSIGSFVDAILVEAEKRLTGIPARTLYLGGGTPSMLSPAHLDRLFGGLSRIIGFDQLDELTFEANPATFDLRKATQFRELGIRRVSLGIQSFHPPTLKKLGREHDAEQAAESVSILRQAGMPSINIDLMFSIPGLGLDDWRNTLMTTIDLGPDHVSAYNLTYEEDTEFLERLREGSLDSDPDRDASQFFLADSLLGEAGFQHYETSNYARAGHRSSHNRGYWRGEDYIGLGPSAVSTVDGIRSGNVPDTDQYVRMMGSIGHATAETETLTAEQLGMERLALMLRTEDGIPLSGLDPQRVAILIDQGLARRTEDRLILTREGSALVDPIASELV